MQIGDTIEVKLRKGIQNCTLEDGPYLSGGIESITVADEFGEIHGAINTNGQWIETD